jgi:ribosomal protein S18 acetylase RimI-like enzyme
VKQVRAIVDQELGFLDGGAAECSDSKSKIHFPLHADAASDLVSHTTFMYVRQKRVVGLVAVESIKHAYRLLTFQVTKHTNQDPSHLSSLDRSTVPINAVLGIQLLWVHKRHRHQGIAKKLVDIARLFMVFGYVVPYHQIALSSPTESGILFMSHYHHQFVDQSDDIAKRTNEASSLLVYDRK